MTKLKARAHFKPPPGFDRLRDAVYAVGAKVFGPDWRPSDWRLTGGLFNPETERVVIMIMEWCAAGEIAAVYWRSNFDVEDLDRKYWRYPDWRHYFLSGKIDLDLPLLDDNGMIPNKDGYKVKCTRDIYLRRQDLDRLIEKLPKARRAPARFSEAQVRKLVAQYLAGTGKKTEDDLVRHIKKDLGLDISRERLRVAYRDKRPGLRPGRRSK